MPMACKGLAKLGEETGELQQIVGKKLAYFHISEHPDGQFLDLRLEEEMGDVLAAIRFSIEKLGLDIDRVVARSEMKYSLFHQWDADERNNQYAVDRNG